MDNLLWPFCSKRWKWPCVNGWNMRHRLSGQSGVPWWGRMQLLCNLLYRVWGKEKGLLMPVNLEKAISLHISNRIRESASSDHVTGTLYTKHVKKMIKQRDYLVHQVSSLNETGVFWKNKSALNTHIQEWKHFSNFKLTDPFHLSVLLECFGGLYEKILCWHVTAQVLGPKAKKKRPNKKVLVMKRYCWIGLTVAVLMRLNGVSSPRI